MRKKFLTIFLLLLFPWGLILMAGSPEGQLINTMIPAPSLKNNIFGIPLEQKVTIYLPPSYENSQEKFPVVYFLSGFSTPIHYFTSWRVFQGFHLKESMDRLISEGKIQEMIVVIPNAHTFLLGSFYTNSSVTGNWEDYIVEDLLSYIDSNFRTKQTAEARGIAGHSMGGSGALELGMKHPDRFGTVYALNPGVFGPDGLGEHTMFASEETIQSFLDKSEVFESLKENEAKTSYMSFITNLILSNDIPTVFSYAYGTAFAPNSQKSPPYIDYPYTKTANGFEVDSTSWKKYENGFGGWAEKVAKHKGNLLKLRSITIDLGMQDYHGWIPEGCIYLSSLLESAGITHQLLKHEGNHGDKLRERLEGYMFPFFSEHFD